VLITKASLGDAPALRARLEALLGRHPPVFTCDYRAERLRRLDGGAELPPQALAGRTVSALCAIARPGGFARTLAGLGAALGELRAYPDHHPYHDGELARLDVELAEAAAAGADEPGGLHPQWVTTEKDAVKLTGRLRHPQGLWVLEMAVTPEPAAQAFFFDFIESGALQ
jgi:tetraacyldisaccharide 4'-kinase